MRSRFTHKRIGRKIVFLAALFTVLLITELTISFKMIAQHSRYKNGLAMLDEIGHVNSVNVRSQFGQAAVPLVFNSVETTITDGDGRASNLKSFFRKHNSPLYDYADVIVSVSDKYGLDYRLIPAIGMQESNLCNNIPENSNNCWGWGIWPGHVTRFDNYGEAIETVAKGLKKNYVDQGLVTATQIMAKYNPSSDGSWAHGVNHFLEALQ